MNLTINIKNKTKFVGGKKMRTSKLRNFTAVFAKVMEVIAWVGTGAIVLSGIAIAALKDQILKAYTEASSFQFTTTGINPGTIDVNTFFPVMIALLIYGLVVGVLLIIMFRNVNLIFKTTNTASPFDISNVSRIKNIGYIALALPVCKIIANIALGFISKDFTIGVEASEVLFGLIILCLAQYFAYGASLEKDVEGLL